MNFNEVVKKNVQSWNHHKFFILAVFTRLYSKNTLKDIKACQSVQKWCLENCTCIFFFKRCFLLFFVCQAFVYCSVTLTSIMLSFAPSLLYSGIVSGTKGLNKNRIMKHSQISGILKLVKVTLGVSGSSFRDEAGCL